jgi:Zn-dependent M32 family carboxypeptidase
LEHIGKDVNNITPTTIRDVYSVMIDNYESLKENDDFDEVFSKLNNVVDELDLIQNVKTPKMVLTSSNKTNENLLSDYNNIESMSGKNTNNNTPRKKCHLC